MPGPSSELAARPCGDLALTSAHFHHASQSGRHRPSPPPLSRPPRDPHRHPGDPCGRPSGSPDSCSTDVLQGLFAERRTHRGHRQSVTEGETRPQSPRGPRSPQGSAVLAHPAFLPRRGASPRTSGRGDAPPQLSHRSGHPATAAVHDESASARPARRSTRGTCPQACGGVVAQRRHTVQAASITSPNPPSDSAGCSDCQTQQRSFTCSETCVKITLPAIPSSSA